MERQNSKQLYEIFLDLTARAIPSSEMASVEETCPIYVFKSEEEVELWERLYKELGDNHAELCKRLRKELQENHAEWLKNNLNASELSQFGLDQNT